MNRDKQIEEMAKAIEEARIKANYTTNSMNYGFGDWFAKELYNADYRKASDVARNIFAEIETSLHYKLINGEIHYVIRAEDYNHYKKKYSEGEE